MESGDTKRRLDRLFVCHAFFALACGALAILFPNIFFFLFHSDGKIHDRHESGDIHRIYCLTRVYGCLIMAQSWIVWNARKVDDGVIRRAFVQAYFGCFVLTFLSLLRAQLTAETLMVPMNWVIIVVFAFLSIYYGYFIFVEKITVFEGLGKSTN
uniref:Uncharacterized protein n=1 Tax=Fibrocapsa japonica TaxID=94617 RepID=A0A7S2UWE6_9STRA|mmetsp:Transcript_14371/g.21142  ORF Transcript_14371/g.21142 Transcript_14371/m.21142 type:complete len:155 (+) Transcript_14371:105-569(+)